LQREKVDRDLQSRGSWQKSLGRYRLYRELQGPTHRDSEISAEKYGGRQSEHGIDAQPSGYALSLLVYAGNAEV
jgi:hypothetical protein